MARGARDHRLVDRGQVDLRSQATVIAEELGADLYRRRQVPLAAAVPCHSAAAYGRPEPRCAIVDNLRLRDSYRAGATFPVEPTWRQRIGSRARPRRADADRGLPRCRICGRALHPVAGLRRRAADRGRAGPNHRGRWRTRPHCSLLQLRKRRDLQRRILTAADRHDQGKVRACHARHARRRRAGSDRSRSRFPRLPARTAWAFNPWARPEGSSPAS
jgi:hypothetical protein